MRKLVLIAAILMASASAHAGSYSFNVEGHNVRVSIPRNCSSLSCISVSAPSITNKFKDEEPVVSAKPSKTTAAPVQAAPAPAPAPAPASSITTTAPVAPEAAPLVTASAPPASKVTVMPAPAPETYSTSPATPAAPSTPAVPETAPVATAPAAPAPAQVAAVAPAPAPVAAAATSPIGIWMSEKKEGKVRIEDCNGNLCGYAVDAKTGANGAKVLINMKPRGDKWTGRINDTRNGGTYDSTIAMRGTDKLKVQGCAFGGMFCGGETWTRVQ